MIKSSPVYLTILLIAFIFISRLASAQVFTEVAAPAGINHVFHFGDFHLGGGATVIDLNNDGWEDVYIAGGSNPDALYLNNTDGTFTDIHSICGINTDHVITQGAVAGDINNDGFKDLFITTRADAATFSNNQPNLLYLNNGDGTFTDITVSSGIYLDSVFSTATAFGDVNLDGLVDLYVGNWVDIPLSDLFDPEGYIQLRELGDGDPNILYINNGDLTFSSVGDSYGVDITGLAWAINLTDYDNDGDLDIMVANDFGTRHLPSSLLRNDYPSPSFTDVSESSGFAEVPIFAMGIATGDYNEDGWLDYYLTDISKNTLYKNNGDGTFTDQSCQNGTKYIDWYFGEDSVVAVGWGANFLDYDNDSYLDLFVANGQLNPLTGQGLDTLYNPNKIFRNLGDYTFSDVSADAGVEDIFRARGSLTFDYDRDGDQDLLVINQVNWTGYGEGTNPKSLLYRNDAPSGNWLKVQLIGTNSGGRDAVGSRIRVKAGGRTLIRECQGCEIGFLFSN